MSAMMAMLPLEQGHKAYRVRSRDVRPRVEPVPGEVELRLGRLVESFQSELWPDLVEHAPVDHVELDEGFVAGADDVHAGLILTTPCIGEGQPVERISERFEDFLRLAGDAVAPVNDGTEYVEKQRLYLRQGIGLRLHP
jgi:hypothetical protein